MGVALSIYDSNWPPKPEWGVEDIPDLTGKVVVVTGANSGIGKETAKALLSHNAKVYIAGRNVERCEAAIRDLKALTGHQAHFLRLDLASLREVKAAAEDFQNRESKLDILINNAGVMVPDINTVTKDGYDLQFGVNVLGHFYFTKLLLPQLITAKSSRIVHVASSAHLLLPHLNFDAFKDGSARRKMSKVDLYNQSKFGNVTIAAEFARRYGNEGVVSTSLHPGLIATELARSVNKTFVQMVRWVSYDAEKGALTSLYAATAPVANGQYFNPWCRIASPHPGTQDPEVGAKLWEWLEEQIRNI